MLLCAGVEAMFLIDSILGPESNSLQFKRPVKRNLSTNLRIPLCGKSSLRLKSREKATLIVQDGPAAPTNRISEAEEYQNEAGTKALAKGWTT